MTDTKPSLEEQIEYARLLIQASLFQENPTAILASLKELAALRLELARLDGEIPYGN